MGRSSHEQALQNRAKIVEAASGLFRRFGVDNVSVADVMRATGMTTGGFYKHFASKDALVEEAFSLAFKSASASWRDVSSRPYEDSARRASAIVEHYFNKKPAQRTCPMLAFAPHVSETASTSCQKAYAEGAEALFDQFLEHTAQSQRGRSVDGRPDHMAKVLFAAMVGAGMLARATGNADWVGSVKEAIQEAAEGGARRA